MHFHINFKSVFNAILVAALLITFSVLPTFAEEEFEGTVIFQMTQGGRKTDMKYMAQGSKMRTEIAAGPTGGTVGIADYSKNKIYVLMPQLQSYMEMEFDAEKLGRKATENMKNASIQETDETQNILGYECKKWISTQNGQTTDIWVAKGLGKFFEPKGSFGQAGGEDWHKKLMEEGGFPFRVIQKDASGKEVYRLEVSKVEKTKLDAGLFAIPPGYRKFDMPNMAGMKGMPAH